MPKLADCPESEPKDVVVAVPTEILTGAAVVDGVGVGVDTTFVGVTTGGVDPPPPPPPHAARKAVDTTTARKRREETHALVMVHPYGLTLGSSGARR